MKTMNRTEIVLTAWLILAVAAMFLMPPGPLPASNWVASLYVLARNAWLPPMALQSYFQAPRLTPSYVAFHRRLALGFVALTLVYYGFLLYGVWTR